ncbi:MAG: tRNA (adenosine(37)-N6)-threonylcarbamoyltransferase complex ATPase subunit type 1 TsaE [Anaerolineales bacterium]|jgi:tRNA threonylcarbamoyladenosine biosynthesis protein TsaE|nr:tRNA (adenosine(37)-N6)-threonylcarbamoyltransferase complex ATPase subunit type 1 TsaE [Anaerolineales bacterium]
MTSITSHSAAETRALGRKLGKLLQPGDLVCLQGELGAGKTTLTQGIAEGWGSLDSVSSPTFVMVNLYRAPEGTPLYHMDAYRIESLPEAEQIGLDDLLAEGALILEWPERIEPILPAERLWLSLAHVSETERQLEISASGTRFATFIQGIGK